MKHFLDSGACASHLHCRTCRDLEAGRAFREQLAAHYEVPVDAPDFACPDGFAWGFEGTTEPRREPEYVHARRAICGQCPHNGKKCELYGGSSCRWKAYLRTLGAVCPADPPKWAYDRVLAPAIPSGTTDLCAR